MLHFGKVGTDGRLEQVKGITYHLDKFHGTKLQTITSDDVASAGNVVRQDVVESAPHKRCLYHIILYLAPGDYHHFHSPVDWNIHIQRHFPGNNSLLDFVPWEI